MSSWNLKMVNQGRARDLFHTFLWAVAQVITFYSLSKNLNLAGEEIQKLVIGLNVQDTF